MTRVKSKSLKRSGRANEANSRPPRRAKRLIRAVRHPDARKRILTLKSLAPDALFAFGVNAALGVEDIVISVVFCKLQKKNAKK